MTTPNGADVAAILDLQLSRRDVSLKGQITSKRNIWTNVSEMISPEMTESICGKHLDDSGANRSLTYRYRRPEL